MPQISPWTRIFEDGRTLCTKGVGEGVGSARSDHVDGFGFRVLARAHTSSCASMLRLARSASSDWARPLLFGRFVDLV